MVVVNVFRLAGRKTNKGGRRKGDGMGKKQMQWKRAEVWQGHGGWVPGTLKHQSHHDPVPVSGHVTGFLYAGGHRAEAMGEESGALVVLLSFGGNVRVISKE